MLEYLRNAADKPLAKFLIAVLAFSFIGWGVAEWIFGGTTTDNTLLRVGGQKISVQQYNMQKSQELASMSRDEQREIYTDPIQGAKFTQKILTSLISETMLEKRADDLGIVISDRRIARDIREFPQFQSNGKFSQILFDNILRNSGYNEAQFASMLRNQILRSIISDTISAPIPVSQFSVDAMYDARYAKRNIEYTTIKFDDFMARDASDEELRSYYSQNPILIPEKRTVSYVIVSADMSKPDSYDAGYATALQVEDDIIGGETLSDTAKKHNAKFVEMKPFAKSDVITDENIKDSLIAKIFEMDESMESELIETKKGFVLLRVDKIEPQHKAEFESVKHTLVKDWANAEKRKKAYVKANDLLVKLNNQGNLDGAKSVSVSRTNGAPIDLLSGVFNNKVGTKTIIETSDAFYVVNIKSESMPDADAKISENLHRELQKQNTTMIQDDYKAFLKRKYPVKINEKTYSRFIEK